MQEYQLAGEFRQHFPAMPRLTARRIAHYYLFEAQPKPRAAAKPIDQRIPNMCAAYVRHHFTEYDFLFKMGFQKPQARTYVQPVVSQFLNAWRANA